MERTKNTKLIEKEHFELLHNETEVLFFVKLEGVLFM